MNVIVCDDHPIVREGIARIIQANLPVQSIHQAENGQALLDLLENHPCDVVVLDVALPGRNGLDVLQQVKQTRPRTPVLMLSVHSADQYAIRALRAGASGYLTKNLAAEELVKAVRTVLAGHKYVTAEVAERLAEDLERPTDGPRHESLSNREFEVFSMLAAGKSVRDISDELSLSYSTINTYRSRILAKLALKTDGEIVRYALRNKLID